MWVIKFVYPQRPSRLSCIIFCSQLRKRWRATWDRLDGTADIQLLRYSTVSPSSPVSFQSAPIAADKVQQMQTQLPSKLNSRKLSVGEDKHALIWVSYSRGDVVWCIRVVLCMRTSIFIDVVGYQSASCCAGIICLSKWKVGYVWLIWGIFSVAKGRRKTKRNETILNWINL